MKGLEATATASATATAAASSGVGPTDEANASVIGAVVGAMRVRGTDAAPTAPTAATRATSTEPWLRDEAATSKGGFAKERKGVERGPDVASALFEFPSLV